MSLTHEERQPQILLQQDLAHQNKYAVVTTPKWKFSTKPSKRAMIHFSGMRS